MIPEEQSQRIKMFGYMERRGKMTIRGRWKQRWCVLEGHLLLYYKSQGEYLSLSPCCGSLNMTLVRKIQPNIGCLINIRTHSKTIILRTPNKKTQEQWFNALATVIMQNNHEGLQYNDSLFPTASLHRKSEKRRRSVRISEVIEQNHTRNSIFDPGEENNNSTTQTSPSNVTENIAIQPILKRNPHDTKFSSDSNIHVLTTKNNFKDFQRSFSCGCISTQLARNQSIATKSICDDSGDQKKKRKSKVHWNDAENDTVSIAENSEHVPRRNLKNRNKNKVIHRHSFSFLKKFLTRRKSRRLRKEAQKQQIKALQQDLNNCFITSIVAVTTTLNVENDLEEITHFQEPSHESSNSLNSDTTSFPVDINDINESIQIMIGDRISPNEVLPELPVKTRKSCPRYSWQKQESINMKSETVNSSTTLNPNTELDQLMWDLMGLNKKPDFLRNPMPPSDDTIPDYDIPRSHLSIISEMLSEPTDTENSSIGSPDSRYHDLSLSMDPDSLDLMTWLPNDELNNHKYWPATSGDHFLPRGDIESDNDDSILDSLNTIKHLS